jgi:uncharacterized Ntn-hydrolase superfamily protein
VGAIGAILALSIPAAPALARDGAVPTLSIVAYDSTALEWGVAVVSGTVACGALVPHAKAGVGAVAVQGPPDPTLGPRALALLERGRTLAEVRDSLESAVKASDARQMALVDARGGAASATGKRAAPWAGSRVGPLFAVQGSWLDGASELEAAARAFDAARGPLAERLLAALGARSAAGTRSAGLRSAALLVVRAGGGFAPGTDRWVDLRVDDATDPLGDLSRSLARWAATILPAAHARLGDEATRLGHGAFAEREYRLAEEGFREAVARSPKDADALNELAWFLTTHDRAPAEAVRFAEAAVLARPGDPNLWDTLAEAHLRAGSLERAIAAAERAVGATADGAEAYQARLTRLRAARAALQARGDSTSGRGGGPSR